jgi:tetratricopeptide (TPR) repeat protein
MVVSSLFLLVTLAQAVPPPAEPEGAEPAAVTAQPLADTSAAMSAVDAGIAAYKKRRYPQAEADFERALKADPNSAAAAYYLGYTMYKRVERRPFHPDKARAARLFDQAFAADPSFRPDWGRRSAVK